MQKLKNKKILLFNDIDKASGYALKEWKAVLKQAVKKRGYFSVVLSGGRTPVSLYKQLAAANTIKWGRTHIFFADERFVSSVNPDSNYRMIAKNLLGRICIPDKNIHLIDIKKSSFFSARTYAKKIKEFFKVDNGRIPRFDLILLGIGKDGHTASLFSADAALKEKKKLAVAVKRSGIEHPRVSITLPVINNARNVFFLVNAKQKALVLKKIFGQDSALPASLVQPKKGRLLFLIGKR